MIPWDEPRDSVVVGWKWRMTSVLSNIHYNGMNTQIKIDILKNGHLTLESTATDTKTHYWSSQRNSLMPRQVAKLFEGGISDNNPPWCCHVIVLVVGSRRGGTFGLNAFLNRSQEFESRDMQNLL